MTLSMRELAKGYSEATDDLELSRGRILPLETARLFYQGRPVVACEFEECSEDVPLNRLLRAAGCDLVASSPRLDRELRHRARVALARMTDDTRCPTTGRAFRCLALAED
jgi:5-methylcytosine-specific restriction endonuclease McrBC regulatory subunit McrC